GSAVVRWSGAEIEEIQADFVVGADGLNSCVRRAICDATAVPGTDPVGTGTKWLELEVTEPWPGFIPDAVDVWPHDPMMLIAFPNRNAVKTVLLFVPDGETLPDFEKFTKTVPELRIGREAYETSLRNQDEVRVVKCRAWSAGRLCVAGDAAHAMAPYLGQG